MRIDVITLFPGILEPVLSASMLRIAREKGLFDVHLHDLRDWTDDPHRTTDDYPYGGGPGMVMKPEPVFRAVRAVTALAPETPVVIFLSPTGERFAQPTAIELSSERRLLLVCGRYEGFDERCFTLANKVLSIGDYVLTGGEIPALAVIDAVVRLIPGVLGHDDSATDESFSTGLLEYPQFTRPASFEGLDVPEVLLSGDHARIARWRREQAIERTARLRPDMLENAALTNEERAAIDRRDGIGETQ